nr:hypothetical protein CFP56_56566 [Quercus suber]
MCPSVNSARGSDQPMSEIFIEATRSYAEENLKAFIGKEEECRHYSDALQSTMKSPSTFDTTALMTGHSPGREASPFAFANLFSMVTIFPAPSHSCILT